MEQSTSLLGVGYLLLEFLGDSGRGTRHTNMRRQGVLILPPRSIKFNDQHPAAPFQHSLATSWCTAGKCARRMVACFPRNLVACAFVHVLAWDFAFT